MPQRSFHPPRLRRASITGVSMLGVVMLVTLSFSTPACSPVVNHVRYDHVTLAPLEAGCELDIYEIGETITKEYDRVGEIYIHDSMFSVDCGRDGVRDLMRERACATGADGVEIIKESYPDAFSTCYRVRAEFLKFHDDPS